MHSSEPANADPPLPARAIRRSTPGLLSSEDHSDRSDWSAHNPQCAQRRICSSSFRAIRQCREPSTVVPPQRQDFRWPSPVLRCADDCWNPKPRFMRSKSIAHVSPPFPWRRAAPKSADRRRSVSAARLLPGKSPVYGVFLQCSQATTPLFVLTVPAMFPQKFQSTTSHWQATVCGLLFLTDIRTAV